MDWFVLAVGRHAFYLAGAANFALNSAARRLASVTCARVMRLWTSWRISPALRNPRSAARQPLEGFNRIRDALAILVTHAEVKQRQGITMIRRCPIPLQGLAIILGYARAHKIHQRQSILAPGITLLSRFAIPSGCFRKIMLDPLTSFKQFTERDLRCGVTLIRGEAVVTGRDLVIPLYPVSVGVKFAILKLGCRASASALALLR